MTTFSQQIDSLADWCLEQSETHHAYNKHDLSNAVLIFQHVVGALAFDFYIRNGVNFDEACQKNYDFGAKCRQMIIEHTGMDLADTWNDPLDAEVLK